MKEYANQGVVNEEKRKLREIDPKLRIGRMELELKGNRVSSIRITIPIKGNSKKIKQLEEDGWKRTFRKKALEDYTMLQCMKKQIEEGEPCEKENSGTGIKRIM